MRVRTCEKRVTGKQPLLNSSTTLPGVYGFVHSRKPARCSKSAAGLLPGCHQADIKIHLRRLLRFNDNKSAASCQQACCKLIVNFLSTNLMQAIASANINWETGKTRNLHHRLRIHRCATRYTSPMISLSHGLRHIHTHFWQVHSFEFQYKCITEKCILPFYKRPGQKHNFTCCLKYAATSFYKYLRTKAILWKVFLKSPFI